VGWIRNWFSSRKHAVSKLASPKEGASLSSQDTLAAIAELSGAVRNNPDAVEIYLALGNLFRSQGEIERAIHIRNTLIARPRLAPQLKSRALYELGLDYKRGGFYDRAQNALAQARKIVGDDPAILTEMARLVAESGHYEQAARYYSLLEKPLQEAHFQTLLAQEAWRKGERSASRKWLNKALRVYPASVEAWLEKAIHAYDHGYWKELGDICRQALDYIESGLGFVLLEGLLRHAHPDTDLPPLFPQEMADHILPVLEDQAQPDLLLYYYGGRLAQGTGDVATARTWYEKSLLLEPQFWPARLELLALSRTDQDLTADFETQLRYLLERAWHVKRFVCGQCGLKRESHFFVCPRCQSWHSITFRTTLNE